LEAKWEIVNLFDRSIAIQKDLELRGSAMRSIHDITDTVCKSTQLMVNLSVIRVTKSWSHATEKMGRMVATWNKCQNQQNMSLSGAVIQEKAWRLNEDQTENTKVQITLEHFCHTK
jgi:uncharacterized membrane protein